MPKTFIVGAQKAYRDGRVYEPGEHITIPDEDKPSRTWFTLDGKPVDAKSTLTPPSGGPAADSTPATMFEAAHKPSAAPPATGRGRASDKSV